MAAMLCSMVVDGSGDVMRDCSVGIVVVSMTDYSKQMFSLIFVLLNRNAT